MKRRIILLCSVAFLLAVVLFVSSRDSGGSETVSGSSEDGAQRLAPDGPEPGGGGGCVDEPDTEKIRWRRTVEVVDQDLPYDPDPHDHVKRFWQGNLRPALRDLGEIQREEGGVDSFTLPLFEEEIVVSVRQFDVAGSEAGVFTGEVDGEPGSLVSLAYVGAAEAGSVHLPSRGQVFEIRAGPGQTIILSEVDVDALGECDLHNGHAAEAVEPEFETLP